MHLQQVEQAQAAAKSVEFHFNIDSVGKSFKRIQKSEKLKKDQEKHKIDELKEKRDAKKAAAEINIQHKKQELREKTNYLKNKDKQKGKLITEIKEALKEDIDQKKEISLLKKKDQMENFERGKNFHQLYKQKLVERILEKKERAERVKE